MIYLFPFTPATLLPTSFVSSTTIPTLKYINAVPPYLLLK